MRRVVTASRRACAFRYMRHRTIGEMGLGGYPAVSLAGARNKAATAAKATRMAKAVTVPAPAPCLATVAWRSTRLA